MISLDALFTTIVTLFAFYGTILTTLILEKKKKPSMHIKLFVIALTLSCVLLLSIAFILYFGGIPFLKKIFLSIQPITAKAAFALENFYTIYSLGEVTFNMVTSVVAMWYVSADTKIGGVPYTVWKCLSLISALLVPYFTGLLVYNHLYALSFVLAIIASVLVNLSASLLLVCITFCVAIAVDTFRKREAKKE